MVANIDSPAMPAYFLEHFFGPFGYTNQISKTTGASCEKATFSFQNRILISMRALNIKQMQSILETS